MSATLARRFAVLCIALAAGAATVIGTAYADPDPPVSTTGSPAASSPVSDPATPTTTTTTTTTSTIDTTTTSPAPPPPTSPNPPVSTTPPTFTTSTGPPTFTTSTSPAPPPVGSDLRVSAVLDRAQYRLTDLVRVTVTITNAGTETAQDVLAFSSGGIDVGNGWGDLSTSPGATILPGATRVVELAGHITGAGASVSFSGTVFSSNPDLNPNDNQFAVSAAIVTETGRFGGLIFSDGNRNRTQDPGETGLAGVGVQVFGGNPFTFRNLTTDAQGRFVFADLPTGQYSVSYSAPFGMDVLGVGGQGSDSLTIDTTDRYADVRLPAVPSLSSVLGVQVVFDRDRYQAGDTTHPTVILTNRGSTDITGVTARCLPGQGDNALRGGPGWGPLAQSAAGVTVPARRFLTVAVTEAVPAGAAQLGYLSAFCDFTAPGYLNPTFASARAAVAGVPGSGRGLVYEDRNGNGSPENGEGLAGVTVVVTDPDTGAVVASPVTDARGGFTVDGVPAASYDLRVAGPWRPRFGFGWFQFAVDATGQLGEQLFGVVSGPEGSNNRPNLKVTVALDKPAYNSGDPVRARLTVTNIGQVAAEGVRAQQWFEGPYLRVDFSAWGELQPFSGPGAHLDPGETRVYDLPGDIGDPDAGAVIMKVMLTAANDDVNISNNTASAIAPVTATFGNYAGVVFGDRNGNGRLDRGEELPGVRVSFSGRVSNVAFDQLTDAHGRFAFSHVPTGRYFVFFSPPAGWVIPSIPDLRVDETDDPDALIRAARPLADSLQASLVFRDRSYHVGDTARVRVTLKNTGRTTLDHVFAWCNGIGDSNELSGSGPGWGQLAFEAGGVTIRAGQTRTFDVTETVPQGADDFGFVAVGCEFTQNFEDGPPGDFDTATIAGKTGTAAAQLVWDANGDGEFNEPAAGVRVALLLPGTHCPAGFATTDANGNFSLGTLPARHYDLLVLGPWRLADDQFSILFVYNGFDRGFVYRLVPRH